MDRELAPYRTGFLARKGDGEPGAKAIWLELREVHVAAKTLRALRGRGNADTSVSDDSLSRLDCVRYKFFNRAVMCAIVPQWTA